MRNTKIIFLCFFLCMVACKDESMIIPEPIDIFKVEQSTISNKGEISFNIPKAGVYIITMLDKNTNQVISREKIKCTIGKNKIKVYTKTITSQYLYLKLEDGFDNELGKTTLTIK